MYCTSTTYALQLLQRINIYVPLFYSSMTTYVMCVLLYTNYVLLFYSSMYDVLLCVIVPLSMLCANTIIVY